MVLLVCVVAAAKFGPPWFDLATSEHAANTYESAVLAESSPFVSVNHKRFVLSQKDAAPLARFVAATPATPLSVGESKKRA